MGNQLSPMESKACFVSVRCRPVPPDVVFNPSCPNISIAGSCQDIVRWRIRDEKSPLATMLHHHHPFIWVPLRHLRIRKGGDVMYSPPLLCCCVVILPFCSLTPFSCSDGTDPLLCFREFPESPASGRRWAEADVYEPWKVNNTPIPAWLLQYYLAKSVLAKSISWLRA